MPDEPYTPPAPPVFGSGGGRNSAVRDVYRLLVETVRDYAIFVLDPQGHIATWNPGAQRFKGYTESEIIGKHFSVFYPREDVLAGKPEMELRVATAEGKFEEEGWRIRKDGTRFWANVVITALRDEHGTVVGFAKVTRDLTERKLAAERAVEDARRLAAADAANRAKAEFLAAMSHELRTPLNAIGGYTDLLALGVHGPVTDDQARALERIRHSQQHLLGIINDLLNYSRIEAGQIQYEIERVSLAAAAEAVVAMLEPQAVNRGITLTMRGSGELAFALADRAKVEQVLLNLLSNALKFTPSGGRVTMAVTFDDRHGIVTVADTGIGIPAERLDDIFEPFVQVGRSLTRPGEGTGLGLAISRDLAQGMSGTLTVTSAEGVGSTFTLTLPKAD